LARVVMVSSMVSTIGNRMFCGRAILTHLGIPSHVTGIRARLLRLLASDGTGDSIER
jgi:hypothetical protein